MIIISNDKVRIVSRISDKRSEAQILEQYKETDDPRTPIEHSETHAAGGDDELTPGDINAETPLGAQAKVDTHEAKNNPHNSSQPRQGGTTANRPSAPANYEFYFDTDLGVNGKPIWYNGSDWVDATGSIV